MSGVVRHACRASSSARDAFPALTRPPMPGGRSEVDALVRVVRRVDPSRRSQHVRPHPCRPAWRRPRRRRAAHVDGVLGHDDGRHLPLRGHHRLPVRHAGARRRRLARRRAGRDDARHASARARASRGAAVSIAQGIPDVTVQARGPLNGDVGATVTVTRLGREPQAALTRPRRRCSPAGAIATASDPTAVPRPIHGRCGPRGRTACPHRAG